MTRSRTYNKGEWTELYVLGRLLSAGAFDVRNSHDLGRLRALRVKRISRSAGGSDADFLVEEDGIRIHGGSTKDRLLIGAFASRMLDEIRQGSPGNRSFGLDAGNDLLDYLELEGFKNAQNKADIYLDVEDPLTGTTGRQGYTIKSFLGSAPSLFNASKATVLTYLISPPPSPYEVSKWNAIPQERERWREIVETGRRFELDEARTHAIFRDNLRMVDSKAGAVLGEMVSAYYSMACGKSASLSDLVDSLARTNPLNEKRPESFYRVKLMDFLEAVALGMVPSKEWDGSWTAPGGLILVSRDGDLNCVPLIDKDAHRTFLLDQSYFDRPAHNRSTFGLVSFEDDDGCASANFQVRLRTPKKIADR